MGAFVDITGQRFGRLTVVSRDANVGRQTAWLCRCDCGNLTTVISANIRRGHTQSCGCLHWENMSNEPIATTTHGRSRRPEYHSWQQMIQRCTNPNTKSWKHYGKKGISVCAEWMSFENFFRDMGERPAGCTIDRIDPTEGYVKDNCRWLDARVNSLRALPNTRHLVEEVA